jgi:protein-S-isoprenylcysteine O-methyltransferase Ste14
LLATEEEQELEEKFGEDFKRYKAQVPGFIPFFR